MSQYQMPLSNTMKRNVDVILNKEYGVGWGNVWRSSGIQITKRPESSIMDVDVKFHGRNVNTNEDFEFVPTELSRINIAQNFEESYCDDITLICTLTPEQMLTVLDNYRNLNCTLKMREKDPVLEFINFNDPIYDEQFKVVIKDKELRKRVSKKALVPDTNLDKNGEQQDQSFANVEFQLIKEPIYLLRKTKFNFQARDVTVRDIICYLAQSCGIKKVSIVDPDNKTKYVNMIIPPQHTFQTCMEFLQDYYGIYEKGLGYYYLGDVLYVYPIYETKPTTPESAHLYYAGPDSSSGSKIFHAFTDKVCHIVISSTPTIKDLVDGGVENYGNAVLFHHADRIIDLQSTIGEGKGKDQARMGLGKIDIKEPNTSLYAFAEDNFGMMDDVYNPEYKFDDSNQYKYRSVMNGYKRSLIGVQWKVAQPDVFKPGYLLHWHYDGEDTTRRKQGEIFGNSSEYMTRTGVCQRVTYDIRPTGSKKSKKNYSYSCNADVVLSVEFEPGKKKEFKKTDTANVATNAFSSLFNAVSNSVDKLKSLASTISGSSSSSTNSKRTAVSEVFSSVVNAATSVASSAKGLFDL